jgi:hypothetical protein
MCRLDGKSAGVNRAAKLLMLRNWGVEMEFQAPMMAKIGADPAFVMNAAGFQALARIWRT